MHLSVVVPAYNEERRIAATLRAVIAFLERQSFGWELIVVDDGSSDATAHIVSSFGGDCSRLRLVRNDHRGKGYAVRTGVLQARGEHVLFMDADLAVPPQDWLRLAPWFESGHDVVIGSREGAGARRIGEPHHRHIMGRAFNMLVRLVALPGIQDTQCGFKAFRREAGQRLFGAARLYGDSSPVLSRGAVTAFDVEVLFLARAFGYRVAEVPVTWNYGEETKVSALRDSWRNLCDLLNVRWNALRGLYAVPPPTPPVARTAPVAGPRARPTPSPEHAPR